MIGRINSKKRLVIFKSLFCNRIQGMQLKIPKSFFLYFSSFLSKFRYNILTYKKVQYQGRKIWKTIMYNLH
jgi:hypothetical protein